MLCFPFFPIPDCCNQMVDPRRQLPPVDDYYYQVGAYYDVETADDQE